MKLRCGFSLVEVIVGMTLLSVAALAIAATGWVAAQAFTESEMREHVLREAESILDSLMVLSAHPGGRRAVYGAMITWSAADSLGSVSMQVVMPGTPPFELRAER